MSLLMELPLECGSNLFTQRRLLEKGCYELQSPPSEVSRTASSIPGVKQYVKTAPNMAVFGATGFGRDLR